MPLSITSRARDADGTLWVGRKEVTFAAVLADDMGQPVDRGADNIRAVLIAGPRSRDLEPRVNEKKEYTSFRFKLGWERVWPWIGFPLRVDITALFDDKDGKPDQNAPPRASEQVSVRGNGLRVFGWLAGLPMLCMGIYFVAVLPWFFDQIERVAGLTILGFSLSSVFSTAVRSALAKLLRIPIAAVGLLVVMSWGCLYSRKHAVAYLNATPEKQRLGEHEVAAGKGVVMRRMKAQSLPKGLCEAPSDAPRESEATPCVALTEDVEEPWQRGFHLVGKIRLGCENIGVPKVLREAWKASGSCTPKALEFEKQSIAAVQHCKESEALKGTAAGLENRLKSFAEQEAVISGEWTPEMCAELAPLLSQLDFEYAESTSMRLALRSSGPITEQVVKAAGKPWVITSGNRVEAEVRDLQRSLGEVSMPAQEARCWLLPVRERIAALVFRGHGQVAKFRASAPEWVSQVPLCWEGSQPDTLEIHLAQFWAPSGDAALKLPPRLVPGSIRFLRQDGSFWGQIKVDQKAIEGHSLVIGTREIADSRPEFRELKEDSGWVTWTSATEHDRWFWEAYSSGAKAQELGAARRATSWKARGLWRLDCPRGDHACTGGPGSPACYQTPSGRSLSEADCVEVTSLSDAEVMAHFKRYSPGCNLSRSKLCKETP